jgi:hypothetical protein
MVELGIQPQWSVALQDAAQIPCDPHGHDYGRTAADPDHFHMADFPEVSEKPIQQIIRQCKRITTGKDHFAKVFILPDVRKNSLPHPARDGPRTLTPEMLAVAMPAVHGTDTGYQNQTTIRVSLDKARHRHVPAFLQRIVFTTHIVNLARIRQALPPDGMIRSGSSNQ